MVLSSSPRLPRERRIPAGAWPVQAGAASYYAVLHYRLGYRGLPFAPVAVLLDTLQAPSFALFPPIILLFPDGRLPSRRWRWVLWVYAGLAVYATADDGVTHGSARWGKERVSESSRRRPARK